MNLAGVTFTEEKSITDWVNRSAECIKFELPINFDEKFNSQHTLACFPNLDIEVMNSETKVLHHSANLFFERMEVKDKLHSLLLRLAIVKDVSLLKICKLSESSNQKNAHYRLPLDEEPNIEHRFIENFVNSLICVKD